MHNVGGMIGGDSPLSPQGEKYAAALPALVLENVGDHPLQVRTQTGRRASFHGLTGCRCVFSVQQVWTSTLQVSTTRPRFAWLEHRIAHALLSTRLSSPENRGDRSKPPLP
jgi:hypothetical protein